MLDNQPKWVHCLIKGVRTMQFKSNDKVWKWVKYSIRIQGLTFNKIGDLYGVHRTCFTGLKTRHCPKYELLLVKILKVDPLSLWPDRYPSFVSPVGEKIKDD
jgi:lambda repressor-like predicted transcriptional regulator